MGDLERVLCIMHTLLRHDKVRVLLAVHLRDDDSPYTALRQRRLCLTRHTVAYEHLQRLLAGVAVWTENQQKHVIPLNQIVDVPRVAQHQLLPRHDLLELVHHVQTGGQRFVPNTELTLPESLFRAHLCGLQLLLQRGQFLHDGRVSSFHDALHHVEVARCLRMRVHHVQNRLHQSHAILLVILHMILPILPHLVHELMRD